MVGLEYSNGQETYSSGLRLLHWIMALGFLFLWSCGFAMTRLVAEDSALEELLFDLHISIGVTMLGLLALRVILRLVGPIPPAHPGLQVWEVLASHLGHLFLYLLPFMVILVGWAETNFGGHSVRWFGASLPAVFPTTDLLWGLNPSEIAETLHRWLAYSLLVLVVVHVLAVVKHRWMDGHDVLHRMTFSRHRSDQ
ncbi:cytochrome b [Rhodovibrionaceae bacterium A322]